MISAIETAGRRSSIALSAIPAEDVPSLRERFTRDHYAVIRGLLSNALLDRIRREIETAEFEVNENKGLKTELCMRANAPATLLAFLFHDPAFFEAVRGITGCDRIGTFAGRVYRMLPGSQHGDSWHDDLVAGRMVAMSVNLSDAPYSGGVLEIRQHQSKRLLQRVANTGFGDAVIFRIARGLQHRVTAVEGSRPKTAYAGWFRSGPDADLLHPGDFFPARPIG